uniref:Major facilitator permease superfamily protein (UMF1) n=1 Tax=uncultured marine group II/III euryarchaeote KM3_57_F04 TaxID=1456465 RepID=A0A075HGG7_9EURY|nr:major facilitator permease superfamily protein (UMF1) [uncultured marine group II/III euryarchaeote KM3_57_F04]
MSEEKARQIRGYCMYDWGKSAFETSVTTAILPAWFAYLFLEANGVSVSTMFGEMTSDTFWAWSVTGGALLVAIVSPAFGVIADRTKIKMKMLRILTYLGAGATLSLALAPLFPISFQWVWLFIMFLFANVGLNGAGVFYNSLLPHQGDESEMDGISNKAYAYGYLGGGILLVIHLGLVMGVSGEWVIPFCMATSGLWWYGFALWTFAKVPEPEIENPVEGLQFGSATRLAITELKSTIKNWRSFKTLFLYMVAYFFFIDGINSVTALAGVYGVAVLGLSIMELIMTIVVIQFVAFPAAFAFTWLADKTSTKSALTVSLIGWCVVIVGALSFAPLELAEHEEYDFQFDWSEDHYNVTMLDVDALGDSDDDKAFEATWGHFLPDDAETPGNATSSEVSDFVSVANLGDTRFSASVSGGPDDGGTGLGVNHPTSLGDGKLDWVGSSAREYVWAPLGLTVMIQFLLLGCMAGLLLGGSQGLARSLFGKIIPETQSTEFFGFFGFFGKVAALIGPMMYAILSTIYDSRVAVASLAILIVIGTILMRFVDIEDGIAVAKAADAAKRASTSDGADEPATAEN